MNKKIRIKYKSGKWRVQLETHTIINRDLLKIYQAITQYQSYCWVYI